VLLLFAVEKPALWGVFGIFGYTVQLKWNPADNAVDLLQPITLQGYFSAVKLAHGDKTLPGWLVSALWSPAPSQL